jgi:hypothetical protein
MKDFKYEINKIRETKKSINISQPLLCQDKFEGVISNDFIKNFQRHFAKILLRNFRSYLFRLRTYKFLKVVKASNKIIRIYSCYLFRKVFHTILQKIIIMQKKIKLYLFAKNLRNLYKNICLKIRLNKRFFIKNLIHQMRFIKKIKSILKKKYLKGRKKIPTIFKKIICNQINCWSSVKNQQSEKSVDIEICGISNVLTKSQIMKFYYESKIKMKLIFLLISNVK